jgi:hypothetical protein
MFVMHFTKDELKKNIKKIQPFVKVKIEMLYLQSVFKTDIISAGEMGEWLKPHVC